MKWIRTEDELPEQGQVVIICCTGKKESWPARYNGFHKENFVCYASEIRFHNVTHWSPLPEPPTK